MKKFITSRQARLHLLHVILNCAVSIFVARSQNGRSFMHIVDEKAHICSPCPDLKRFKISKKVLRKHCRQYLLKFGIKFYQIISYKGNCFQNI